MTQIDQIKAEIERRKNKWQAFLDICSGRPNVIKQIIYEDSKILAFIDSLPEDESSENIGQLNSLEKAAKEYACDGTVFLDTTAYRAFKFGAQWQKEQMLKEHPPILDKYYKLPQKR